MPKARVFIVEDERIARLQQIGQIEPTAIGKRAGFGEHALEPHNIPIALLGSVGTNIEARRAAQAS